jgi:capsular exopolysaccharide synthesis family protein
VASTAPLDTLQLTFSAVDVTARNLQEEVRQVPYGEPIEFDGVSFTVGGPPDTDEATWIVDPREKAIDRVMEKMRVRLGDQTHVARITFESPNPLVAQQLVNAVIGEFQELDADIALNRARRRREFLEAQLQLADSTLRRNQYLLSRQRGSGGVLSAEEELEARRGNRMALQAEKAELEAEQRSQQTLLDRLDTSDPGIRRTTLRSLAASPAITANPIVDQLFRQLVAYQVTYDSLTTGAWRKSADNPDVQRLDQLISGTEGELIDVVRSHVDALSERIAALDELQTVTAGQMSLIQEVETFEKLADQLREELNRARMAEAAQIGEVEVVDYAALPYQPLDQLELLKLVLGLMVGLGLGMGVAFMREQGDRAIRRREQLERILSVPWLAVIPRVAPLNGNGNGDHSRTEPNLLPWPRSGLRPRNAVEEKAETESSEIPVLNSRGLVAVSSEPSIGAEAYRVLRSHLLFSASGDEPMKSVVVTSPSPDDGKTLTAANLAGTYAAAGSRVLLVDGDLWRGNIHALFGVPRSPGIVDILSEGGDPKDALVKTEVPNLWLLPAGKKVTSPGNFVNPEDVRLLLYELEPRFDLIVIDTAPVLAVADTVIVAALVDGVVLVVRAGATRREMARDAMDQLERVGARVVGAVLNDPKGGGDTYSRYRYEYTVGAS